MQILAIDVGTETLPALALGREPAEPGLMDRPPRPRRERRDPAADAAARLAVPRRRSAPRWRWAASSTSCSSAGWSPGDPTGEGDPLHHAYQQATTMTFLGMVAGPDRHGVRGAHRARVAALGRRLHQPPAAVGHRLRAGARRGLVIYAAAASRRCSAPPRSRPDVLLFVAAVPVHRLGRRRAAPLAAAAPRPASVVSRGRARAHPDGGVTSPA